MAIAGVQTAAYGTPTTTNTATSAAFGAGVSTANVLVAVAFGWDASNIPSTTANVTFTDSKGNSGWVTLGVWRRAATNAEWCAIGYLQTITTGGTAFTVTATQNTSPTTPSTVCIAREYSGLATSSVSDKTISASGTTQSEDTTATATLSQADELAVAVHCGGGASSSVAFTPNQTNSVPASGWTVRNTQPDNLNYASGCLIDVIVSATTGVRDVSTVNVASPYGWVAAIATFKGQALVGADRPDDFRLSKTKGMIWRPDFSLASRRSFGWTPEENPYDPPVGPAQTEPHFRYHPPFLGFTKASQQNLYACQELDLPLAVQAPSDQPGYLLKNPYKQAWNQQAVRGYRYDDGTNDFVDQKEGAQGTYFNFPPYTQVWNLAAVRSYRYDDGTNDFAPQIEGDEGFLARVPFIPIWKAGKLYLYSTNVNDFKNPIECDQAFCNKMGIPYKWITRAVAQQMYQYQSGEFDSNMPTFNMTVQRLSIALDLSIRNWQ